MSEIFISSWFWTMAQCVVVAITAVALFLQIRAQTHSHIVIASEAILARWNSAPTLRLRRSVAMQGLEGDQSFDATAQALAEVIENMAMYVRHGAVPEKVLWTLLSWSLEHYYQLFKKGIEREQNLFKDRTLFNGIVEMDRRFRRITGMYGVSTFDRGDDEMKKFLSSEVSYCEAVLAAGEYNQATQSAKKRAATGVS